MEDFLLPELSTIRSYIKDKEICGILTDKGYINLVNLAEDLDEFIIDPKELYYASKGKTVLGIVHSHSGSTKPSAWDITQCNQYRLPFIIVNFTEYSIIFPEKHQLEGRIYEFGKYDCFEAVRDWYLAHDIYSAPRLDWRDDWWETTNENYIDELIQDWNLTKVSNLQYGDVLTFKIRAPITNHLGVYEDNDIFYHHPFGRLSLRENLYPMWGSFINGIYRHEEASKIRRIFR